MQYNEIDIRNAVENQGKSMSWVARQLGKKVAQISAFCKRKNIKSKFSVEKKELPLNKIKEEYLNGVSMYKLGKRYKRPPYLIKKHLLNKFPDLEIRDMDKAKRPPELNDPDELFKMMQDYSLTQIGKKLGVKTQTVSDAAVRLGLRDNINRQEIEIPKEDLIELYVKNKISTSEIAKIYDTYPPTVLRHLRKLNVKIRPPGGISKSSKYPEFNNEFWMRTKYLVEEKSANEIANMIGCRVGLVFYYLNKYNIKIRSKEKNYAKLRRKQSKSETVSTKWGKFRIAANSEKLFINSIPNSAKEVEREPITFKHKGLHYTPDFKIDGEFIEIKPIGYAKYPGVNRQKFIKQKCIAEANGVNLKTWYKGKYFEVEPISDLDRYFSLNWKLIFNSSDEVYDFYKNYGFMPLQYWKDNLLKALNCLDVPEKHCMSATYNNIRATEFLKHFNPHFWNSKYKNWNAPADAFKIGNLSILKKAIEITWDSKQKCNIYRLMSIISRKFRDFRSVSLFKPWVARHLYRKYLPNGGILVDPCMGWGGRLLATLDYDIQYIGYDLNQKAVDANKNIVKFVGNRWLHKPKIYHGNSSKIVFPKSDLIFTSPPYDDTEYYFGLKEQCKDTTPIYYNIFSADTKIIMLNVPLRHEKIVCEVAKQNNWNLIQIEKMFTKSLVRHEKTYEPILVFKK